MAGEDKQWASKYLLDPLTAPEPSEETGPGTHHISTLSHNNPYRNSTVSGSPSARKPSPEKSARTSIKSVHTPRSSVGYPTPPSSRSSRTPQFDNTPISSSRNSASNISTQIPTSTGGQYSSHSRRSRHIENTPTASARNSLSNASTQIPTSTGGRTSNTGRPSRHNSLPSRYAGDKSNRPLETLIRENKKAYRAPHLRKQFIPGFDSIDTLDKATSPYHHEGPYDATLLSRNLKTFTSPVAAVRGTNEEALKATPPEMIQDSLKKHRPLDGVAIVPPGMQDLNGRTYDYVEGTDLMRENGADYKRWPGVKYLPEDLKGKGEPSYSLEKALKDHKRSNHRRGLSDGNEAIEMASPRSPQTPPSPFRDEVDGNNSRPQSAGSGASPRTADQNYKDWESGLHHRGFSGSMRRRFGSLRGRKHGEVTH